jgi:hypothetical protein
MIFIDYAEIIAYCILCVFVAIAVLGIRIASRKGRSILILSWLFLIVVLFGGWVTLASYRLGKAATTSISPPTYSPDHRHALRIEDDKIDSGARTTVYLYSGHGFIVSRVFYGTLGSVKAEDLHWLSNSEVLISYAHPSDKQFCKSTQQVKVSVEPRSSVEAERPHLTY